MHPHLIPLNPVVLKDLQQWLGLSDGNTLRKVIRAKIVQAKCEALRHLLSSVADAQYLEDAKTKAAEADFYEKVLLLLGTIEAGHNPDKPEQKFEYLELTAISDQEPLTT